MLGNAPPEFLHHCGDIMLGSSANIKGEDCEAGADTSLEGRAEPAKISITMWRLKRLCPACFVKSSMLPRVGA